MKRAAGWSQGAPAKRIHSINGCGFKMLVSQTAASGMIGKGGGIIREIQQATGAKIHLSGRDEFYPGTNNQEVNIQAATPEGMEQVINEVLSRTMQVEEVTEAQEIAVRVVVPCPAATAIIGKGGETIKQLRVATNTKIRIEEQSHGAPPGQEQIVVVNGVFETVIVVLAHINHYVQELRGEAFFNEWVSMSCVTAEAWQGGDEGGGGKAGGGKGGAGKSGGGKGGGGKAGGGKGDGGKVDAWGGKPAGSKAEESWGTSWHVIGARNDWVAQKKGGKERKGAAHAPAPPEEVRGSLGDMHDPNDPVESVVAACQHLPNDLMLPGAQSIMISMAVPATMVSAIIGKSGSIIKDITAATATKIMIREAEGDESQKVVQITGPPVGIAAAYIRVIARVAEIERGGGAGDPSGFGA